MSAHAQDIALLLVPELLDDQVSGHTIFPKNGADMSLLVTVPSIGGSNWTAWKQRCRSPAPIRLYGLIAPNGLAPHPVHENKPNQDHQHGDA